LISIQSTRGSIPKELRLDREPDSTGGGTTLGDDVGEVVGNGTEEPGADDAIHPYLGRRPRGDDVGEDMGLQRVLAEDVEEGRLPASIEGRGDVKEQRYQSADVLDRNCLSMEVEDDFGLLLKKGVVKATVAAFRVIIADVLGDIVARRGSGTTGRGGARLGIVKASRGGVDFRLGGRGLVLGRFRGREGSGAHLLRTGLLHGAFDGVVAAVKGHGAEQSRARRDAARAAQHKGALEAALERERERAWSSAGRGRV